MERNELLSKLYEYASTYHLSEFRRLSDEIISAGGGAEAYLLRAQVKLFAADKTLQDDLAQADAMDAAPSFPCLYFNWVPQDPNTFVVFNKGSGALREFLDILPGSGETLSRWYGDIGLGMAHQIMSEILYFTSEPEKAIEAAIRQYENSAENCLHAMMSAYVLFRCYLALDNANQAKAFLLKIIKLARTNAKNPTCALMYRTIREWANLTTGWSGDTPRYHQTPDGSNQPVLEDRTAAIQKGISQLGLTEEPFVVYASQSYADTYTLRKLYMDIFNAMYHHRALQLEEAGACFSQAYQVSQNSGIVMPFAEYGRQIIPLLDHFSNNRAGYSQEWLDRISALAERYEQSIDSFRD